MVRGQQVVRVLRLRRYLEGKRYTSLTVLASEFGVTTRTIRRDLETLEEAHEHVPIWRYNESLACEDRC